MMKLLLCNAIALFSLTVAAQTTTEFRLAGTYSSQLEKAGEWRITQELVDEETGKSLVNKNFAFRSGKKLRIKLRKIKNKETIYHVIEKANGSVRKHKIRVFHPNKVSSFLFETKLNPPVRTYIFVPQTLSSKTRILLVMHGLSRNADDYIASWKKWAKKTDHIVVAPNFDNKRWPGSRMYNLGNILKRDGLKNHSTRWSFRVVEDLYQSIQKGFNLQTGYFDIFGHSAGGQFVHRFMFFMPESKVRVALAANSGWYTAPDLETRYPYGFKHPAFSYTENDLLRYSKRKLFILRGTADTERTKNLRQTAEADAQGSNRYERAGYMFDKIKVVNHQTNWRLIDAPGIGHEQKRMAVAAQHVLDEIDSQPKKGKKK